MPQGTLDSDYYLNRADDDLDVAGDWSKVPLVGEGMAAGEFAKARQNMGRGAESLIAGVDTPIFGGGYQVAGEYDPAMADYETINEDPRLRDLQMSALDRLAGGLDDASIAKADASRFAALDEGNQLANAREGAIRMQGERSGQGGAGQDAMMQAQAAQMGANRARVGTMDAVHQKALEQLSNQQAMIGAAGNVRGQDFQAKNANANIINQFGMFNTQAANEAKKLNLNNYQNVSNANVGRNDNNAQTMFGNAMTKATARGNALQGMSNAVGQGQQQQAAANASSYQKTKDVVGGIAGLFTGE